MAEDEVLIINSSNVHEVARDLESMMDLLENPKDRNFADSLINGQWGLKKRGYLTASQMHWLGVLFHRALTGRSPPSGKKTLSGLSEAASKL